MPQQCAEPPPRPPPTGAKQGHNPPTTPPPQPDSPGKPPKPHPPNPTHPRGSSPHTRGAPSEFTGGVRGLRIIPAYAGSTTPFRSDVEADRDHPRIRGEHCCRLEAAPTACGSSPHTRGARRFRSVFDRRSGIIPAYAGSTSRRRPGRGPASDHPRIRGEHCDGGVSGLGEAGSSPHTRGAPPRGPVQRAGLGIIPAYAGSTLEPVPGRLLGEDHPRIRGEHHRLGCAGDFGRGSSPHTRGALSTERGRYFRGRIIPAYAGSTSTASNRKCRPRDHPRIRGEHI